MALLTYQVTSQARKGFQSRRLLSVPKEKSFPSVRNVSGAPDRPREEIPRRGSGWAARPGRKKEGLCPCLNNFGRCSDASNSRRRTVLDLGQPAESNWGGVTADLLAERESGEGGEFADRSERTHASLSLATNYSSAQRIAAIKSLTCGKTLL